MNLGILAGVVVVVGLVGIFMAWLSYDARYNSVNRHRAPGFWNWFLNGATEPDD